MWITGVRLPSRAVAQINLLRGFLSAQADDRLRDTLPSALRKALHRKKAHSKESPNT